MPSAITKGTPRPTPRPIGAAIEGAGQVALLAVALALEDVGIVTGELEFEDWAGGWIACA